MVKESLDTLAEIALSNARRQLEATEQVEFKVGLQHPSGKLEWVALPKELLPALNDQKLKAILFNYFRQLTKIRSATAVVMASDSWAGIPTEKQKRMAQENPEELHRLAQTMGGIDDWETAGLVTRAEAVTITVQTPEEVLILRQIYQRAGKRIIWGERLQQKYAQAEFEGKTKMYQ